MKRERVVASAVLSALLFAACAPRVSAPLNAPDRAQVERDVAECAVEDRSHARGSWPRASAGWNVRGFWPADVAALGALLIYSGAHWLVEHEHAVRELATPCLEGVPTPAPAQPGR